MSRVDDARPPARCVARGDMSVNVFATSVGSHFAAWQNILMSMFCLTPGIEHCEIPRVQVSERVESDVVRPQDLRTVGEIRRRTCVSLSLDCNHN